MREKGWSVLVFDLKVKNLFGGDTNKGINGAPFG